MATPSPTAGTDLASLTTRAVRDGDEWIVNGQKIWTTGGHEADWVWLATRSDPEVPKHKGITIFAVDTTLDGFSHTPIWLLGGGHTNATYYNDMRVPDWARIGEVNGGWRLITAQLNHERVGLAPAGNIDGPLRRVVDWARQTTLGDGRRVIDQEWVRLALAEVYARNEALKMYNWKVAAALEDTELKPADASAMKVFGTELKVKSFQALMEVLGQRSYLVKGTPEAVLAGELERAYRGAPVGTFGGGVNEVQRDIIATAGLGLPRSPR